MTSGIGAEKVEKVTLSPSKLKPKQAQPMPSPSKPKPNQVLRLTCSWNFQEQVGWGTCPSPSKPTDPFKASSRVWLTRMIIFACI